MGSQRAVTAAGMAARWPDEPYCKRPRHDPVANNAQQAQGQPITVSDTCEDDAWDRAGSTKLERLCAPAIHGGAGLDMADIAALAGSGIPCVEALTFLPLRRLLEIRGMDMKKAQQVMSATQHLVPIRMMSCADMLHMRRSMFQITTGSAELDCLLGGGIEPGQITEMFGQFCSGKTQLCHTLAVTCQLPTENGGCESKVLYLDTENTFRPERLVAIARRFGIHEEDVLENVTCAKAFNAEHQDRLLDEVDHIFGRARYGLLIVDSATALFRTDYSGNHEMMERQQALNVYLRKLQRMADTHGVAVVITNQVMATPGGEPSPLGQQVKAVGGNIMGHASQTRLFLRKAQGNLRICRLVDSSSLAEGEALFAIEKGGVADGYSSPAAGGVADGYTSPVAGGACMGVLCGP